MNEELITTSLDESLLALGAIEQGALELAVAHATISSALATVAAAEANLLVTLPRTEQRRAVLTSVTWIEEIQLLAGPATPPGTTEEGPAPMSEPVIVTIETPGRGPRGRTRAAFPPT